MQRPLEGVCGKQNNAPQMSRTYKYVTLHGKRDFADKIKLRILRLPWIIWCNYKGSYRERGRLERENEM